MPRFTHSLLTGLIVVIIVVIYAYGFSVTQVNLDELDSPDRQQSLTRILRALARPNFFEFDQEEVAVETPVWVPCPSGEPPAPSVAPASGPYMTVTPACGDPNSEVTVEGFGFAPNSSGPLNFIPPSGVSLQIGRIETDGGGHFLTTVELRDRPNAEAQMLRAITRTNVGGPHLSQNGRDTIDKIIETVFMALLATTLGTLLAIPISFFAAQNLMRTVTSPVPSVALSIILAPAGVWLGARFAGVVQEMTALLAAQPLFSLGGLLAAGAVAWLGLRLALPGAGEEEERGDNSLIRIVSGAVMAVAVLAGAYFLADLLEAAGVWLATRLGLFDFVGDFVADIGGIIRLLLPVVCALIGAGLFLGVAGSLGQWIAERFTPATGKIVNLILGALAGAVLLILLGLGVGWLYQITNWRSIILWPGVIGGILGLGVAALTPYNASLPTGYVVYTVTRTILNALRSVEALIMVIVFAVWVGIGPFAGVLALGLHTVAALAKLYSEQVESIMEGPLEAILATGANRLQMIVYAVIPQIIPPYISFTMYRWDINVRMSTIIGFAGGGGIGFLLQQNINLLNYRSASAQILAIAIVVSLMDYLSSALRQRTL
ncbi:MAG: ABC transporter permease subunit [Caldilineaceae bacterium]|nr:ABC transporter permease subunit [Caldilineaceae bacterium]